MNSSPTSRELIALTNCKFTFVTPFALYVFDGAELHLSMRGVHLPPPYCGFDVEEIWVEIPGVSLCCVYGKSKGAIVMEGAVHLASA